LSVAYRGNSTVFHVDEKIKGVTSDYFDLEAYLISGHFEIGKEYLAFADVVPLEDGEHFFATQECGPTSELKYAHAVRQQVRAEKTANETQRSMECCCVHRT
jgi:hypothetical protein